MFNLQDKIALVTGATGGIGAAIAKVFYDQGATVILTGRRQEVLDEMVKTMPDRSVAMAADLGEAKAGEELIKKIEAEYGRLDILVNNAGLTKDGLLMRMSDEDWRQVMDVNLDAVFRLTRAAIKGMMKQRKGRVINITSVVGTTGNPGQTNYVASKAAMTGFSKALAQEVASRGITVNCLAPGFIETPMTDKLNDQQKETIMKNIPLARMGTPDDIAAAVLYLAADESAYMTGQTLHVNGGMAMI